MPGSAKTKAWSEGNVGSKTFGSSEMPQIAKVAKVKESVGSLRQATLTQVIRKNDGKRANGGMKGRTSGGISRKGGNKTYG